MVVSCAGASRRYLPRRRQHHFNSVFVFVLPVACVRSFFVCVICSCHADSELPAFAERHGLRVSHRLHARRVSFFFFPMKSSLAIFRSCTALLQYSLVVSFIQLRSLFACSPGFLLLLLDQHSSKRVHIIFQSFFPVVRVASPPLPPSPLNLFFHLSACLKHFAAGATECSALPKLHVPFLSLFARVFVSRRLNREYFI